MEEPFGEFQIQESEMELYFVEMSQVFEQVRAGFEYP